MSKRTVSPAQLEEFTQIVWERGQELYRNLPWRNTFDPYAILLSEVMLQQTQVTRVLGRWEEWLDTFPTIESLANAPLPPVLELWQGMGYNRRAINLKRCAEKVQEDFGGVIPQDKKDLLSLPGVGPSTSAGVRIFAYSQPDVYIETNVRAVFIHELFPEDENVSDKDIKPLVEAACPQGKEVRDWYYALLDYGAFLKKAVPNPSRRSKQYVRQSKFEGSHRQKRSYILREVLREPMTADQLFESLLQYEESSGRSLPTLDDVKQILSELGKEGFITEQGGVWVCAE